MRMSRIRLALLALWLLAVPVVHASAGITLTVKPGEWCDVVLHPDGFAFVRQTGSTVIAEVNGVERWRVTLPEPTLYLRAAAAPNGAILALGQSQSGRALVTMDGGPAQDFGEAFGQNGLLAWHDGTRFVVWIQRSPDAATRTEIGGAESLIPLPWTSQGFRDVSADGTPLLGDQWFQRTIRGRSIHEPVVRGNLWAGQWSTGREGIAVLADDQDVAFTAIAGLGFEPHFARAGDRLAVAARTPGGAALAIITPPYPPTEPITPPHVDPVDPVDPVGPVDPPASCGAFSSSEREILVTVGAKYQELRKGDDDQRRAFTLHLAQQLAFSVSREWGTKRADPGRPPSKDAVARVIGGRLCSWDVINGTTREMVLDAQGEDITGQIYIAVDPVDVLGGPVIPIDPPVDLTALKARVAELEHQLAEFQDLHARDAAQIDALTTERNQLQAQLAEARAALDAATSVVYGCEVKLPGWAKSLGLKVGCTVVARPRQ